MSRAGLAMMAVLVSLTGCMGPAEETSTGQGAVTRDRWSPIVLGTDDLGGAKAAKPQTPAPAPSPAKAGPPVRVDQETRAVRIPVALTRGRGVVEWLLSAGRKHQAASVMVTDCSARELAKAFAQVGYTPGTRPEAVNEDRARPAKGMALQIDLVVKGEKGKETRIPAARLLARTSEGEPVADGDWIYVGPQTVHEDDTEILVAELIGSLVTTNLRDASALAHWVPKLKDDPTPYVTAYYTSNVPLPAEGSACELEIRPAK